MSDYARIGEDRLRAVMRDFVARTSSDMIIGFFFAGHDLERIADKEFELARVHLGGGGTYTGKPIGAAHKPKRINGGHFRRRLALLRVVLREHQVDEDIIERWMEHDSRLLSAVTDGTDCLP